MNSKEIKNLLQDYCQIDLKIEAKNRQLCRLIKQRERLCNSSNNSRNSFGFINWDLELEKFILEDIKVLINDIDKLIDKREYIENMVNSLGEFERRLITLRYFLKKSFVAISFIMNYSESSIYRWHKKIIKELGTIANDNPIDN